MPAICVPVHFSPPKAVVPPRAHPSTPFHPRRRSLHEPIRLLRAPQRGAVLDLGRFVDAICLPASAHLSQHQVVRGAPTSATDDFSSKYLTRFSRTGAFAPSDIDPREVQNAAAGPPSARLRLEHVYGYAGLRNTAQNLFYTKQDRLVYYTAGIGVVCGELGWGDANKSRGGPSGM